MEINGHGIGIGESTIGYRPDGFTPITHLIITVAYDYNMTNRFTIHAATLKGLLGEIRRHKSNKLVKPKPK